MCFKPLFSKHMTRAIEKYGAHTELVEEQEVINQLSETNIEIAPGCLAGLPDGKESYEKLDQIIFRKPK